MRRMTKEQKELELSESLLRLKLQTDLLNREIERQIEAYRKMCEVLKSYRKGQ